MRSRALVAAVVAAALCTVSLPVRAAEDADASAAGLPDRFLLDEYNIDVGGGQDSARLAAGLSFGTGYGNGWWWTAGARLMGLRWQVDCPTEKGYGVGGTFGGGWHPEKTVSPFASIALDRVWSVGSVIDSTATLQAGARVRVTPDPQQHFTMTFAIYQANGFGGNGPSGSDYGIAVLYSAALFARKK
jgi:hypothetical protein